MWQTHQITCPACVLTGYCVWLHWCETGTAPQSSAQSYRWCTGSPSAWKLAGNRRESGHGIVERWSQPCVLTWSRGRSVRLHQLYLCHLLSVLLADVVLLGHERVVERCLAHGAETVGVVVVVSAATAACQRAAGILRWFLPGLYWCWCLKGCWKPTMTEKGKGNWKELMPEHTGYTHMESVDQWTSASGSWRELCPGSATRPPRGRRTSCYTHDKP